MSAPAPYPVRVEARLDPNLSRWLWLVKWLLAMPHYLVLAFLWFAFSVLTAVAFFAILFTGRYPRSIFEFNVGVLRWTWRVQYYAYAALGTDQYPPFTFADVPEYPARLEIDYPERLSRGLVLVKWWLLAIPHYVVAGLFAGGGLWFAAQRHTGDFDWAAGGLVGVLVCVAGVVLLCTGRYPRPIHDFVLGMDRWVIRVGAYAALMTDEYPPFRLDLGGEDPAGPLDGHPGPGAAGPGPRWSGGRIASVVGGSVLTLIAAGLLTGGAALLWADRTGRDADGYLTLAHDYTTSACALTTDPVVLTNPVPAVGDIRVRVTGRDSTGAVFVGIAPTEAVRSYLAPVSYATIRDPSTGETFVHSGQIVVTPPQDAGVWTTSATGIGKQTVTWPQGDGDWTVVVMNADGAPGVAVHAEIGATAPGLAWISALVLGTGAALLAGGVALIVVAVHRAARSFQEQ